MRSSEARLPLPAKPLRVVHLAGSIGPDAPNGVDRAVYYLAKAQRALGHEVTVVGAREPHLQGTGANADEGWIAAKNRVARKIRFVSPTLTRELIAYRPDLVHLHSVHVPEHVSLARTLRRANLSYCVTVHGGLSRAARRRSRWKKAVMWWIGERELFGGALFVHALTREEADDVRRFGIRRPTVVAPNGIDPDSVLRPRNPNALYELVPDLARRRIFMFIGRLAVAQKGLDLLLEAFAHANLLDACLVLVGPDWRDGRATLERAAASRGVHSRVVFLGAQEPQRCADLIAGADVFVHTSRWEGVSLAVLEAAVSGKPCLLTDVADPDGAIGSGDGALIVSPTSSDIARGLRALSHLSRSELAMMGARARDTVVNRFKWSCTAHTLIQACREAGIG